MKGEMALDKLVMTVLIVAILAAASALILENFRDADAMLTADTTNETVTLTNNTYNALGNPRLTAVTIIGNATGQILNVSSTGLDITGNTTELGNATASSFQLLYKEATGTNKIANGAYWVVYSYEAQTTAYNTTDDGLGATGDITGWLGIIVIIVIAVFIIFLVRQLGSGSA